jgi:hypothetical protein
MEDELLASLDVVSVKHGLCLQHDDTPAPFARQFTVCLNQHVRNCWIGELGTVAWPPRSPDLIPLEQCFCERMGSLVAAAKSSVGELLKAITDASGQISVRKPVACVSQTTTMCLENKGQVTIISSNDFLYRSIISALYSLIIISIATVHKCIFIYINARNEGVCFVCM